MEEDKEFQIKILTEIMKKQQELINNIFNIIEKDYIKKSKFEEDFAYREPLKNYSDFDRFCYNHCKDIETVLNIIEELKKYEQYYKEQNEVNAKFVPKSKVQDKIDELEKEYKKVQEKYYLSQYISISEYEILQKNQGYIKVLQELLEEE